MLLQPTAPLRTSTDILESINIYQRKNAKSVVSVCEASENPDNLNKLKKDHCLKDFLKQSEHKQRQETDTYYKINGAIYLSDIKTYLENKSFYTENSFAYIMPTERSIDIDTELDFQFAEFLIKRTNVFHAKDAKNR
jgi:CMP-N,N'-diacetyllegionaminic acid synthase